MRSGGKQNLAKGTKPQPPDAYTVLPTVRLVYDELKYETVTNF